MENEYIKFETRGNCLIGEYKVSVIDLEIAKSVVDLRLEMHGGTKLVGIILGSKVINLTKEARDFLGSDHGVKDLVAGAMVIDSTFKKNMFNFFLKFNKPNIPSKIFTDIDSALKWGESQML